MSVHKVVKPDSPFEIFPRATLQDRRLNCFELGALARLCSLPAGWEFSARGLERLLDIGKDKRQALLSKLASCGYYRVMKRHARSADCKDGASLKISCGQWVYEHEFSSLGNLGHDRGEQGKSHPDATQTSAGFSGGGESEESQPENSRSKQDGKEPDSSGALSAGAGSTGTGESGSIDRTQNQDKTDVIEHTPQQHSGAPGGSGLVFPKLHKRCHRKIAEMLAEIDPVDGQLMLDELAARLSNPDPQFKIRNPVRWFESLVKDGCDPTPAGLAISEARVRQQQSAAAVLAASSLPAVDLAAQAVGQQMLNRVRECREPAA